MSSDLMLMLWDSFVETVIMVGLSGFIGSVFGIPLGILLHVTDNGGVHPMPIFNKVLGWIINALRSPLRPLSHVWWKPACAKSTRD